MKYFNFKKILTEIIFSLIKIKNLSFNFNFIYNPYVKKNLEKSDITLIENYIVYVISKNYLKILLTIIVDIEFLNY